MIDASAIGAALQWSTVPVTALPITFAARFKIGSVLGNGAGILNIINNSSNYIGLRNIADNSLRLRSRIAGVNTELNSGVIMATNSQYFAIAKIDSAGNAYINVNGTTATAAGFAMPAGLSVTAALGSNAVATLGGLRGLGGEFGIWNTDLPNQVIIEMMATGFQGGVLAPFSFLPYRQNLVFHSHVIDQNFSMDQISQTNVTGIGSISDASDHIPFAGPMQLNQVRYSINGKAPPAAVTAGRNPYYRLAMTG